MQFTFGKEVYPGETSTIEMDGFEVTAEIHYDDDAESPWEGEDGHGPVSDWTSRDKKPGERVLLKDHRSYRYYDFAEAVKIAKRDGWGSEGDEGLTAGAKAAKAAEADFERLRRWCADDWCYIGVSVKATRNGIELGHTSLWRIESDCGDYVNEVSQELAEEAVREAKEAIENLVNQ